MSEKIKDQNLIAYCGLYCADCHGHSGKIADELRKDYLKNRGGK